MAGTARFGLLHFRHGIVAAFFEVENGVVANLAVVVILLQMEIVTEDHRIGILKRKRDIFSFLATGDDRNQQHRNDDSDKQTPKFHDDTP